MAVTRRSSSPNLERDNRNQQQITGLGTVPTAEFKKGDFSNLLNPGLHGRSQIGHAGGNRCPRPPDRLWPDLRPFHHPDRRRRHCPRSVSGQHHSPDALGSRSAERHSEDRHPGSDAAVVAAEYPYHQRAACVSPADLGAQDRPPAQFQESAIRLLQPQLPEPVQQRRRPIRAVPRPGLQFVAATDHSGTPGAALAQLHYFSAHHQSRGGRFQPVSEQNGAYPTTINANLAAAIGLQNLPGTVFPVFQFNGPGSALQGNSIARMGVGGADTSPNGSWIFQDDVTWLHGCSQFSPRLRVQAVLLQRSCLVRCRQLYFQCPPDRFARAVDEHRATRSPASCSGRCTVATITFRDIPRASASRSTAYTSWMTGKSRPS